MIVEIHEVNSSLETLLLELLSTNDFLDFLILCLTGSFINPGLSAKELSHCRYFKLNHSSIVFLIFNCHLLIPWAYVHCRPWKIIMGHHFIGSYLFSLVKKTPGCIITVLRNICAWLGNKDIPCRKENIIDIETLDCVRNNKYLRDDDFLIIFMLLFWFKVSLLSPFIGHLFLHGEVWCFHEGDDILISRSFRSLMPNLIFTSTPYSTARYLR